MTTRLFMTIVLASAICSCEKQPAASPVVPAPAAPASAAIPSPAAPAEKAATEASELTVAGLAFHVPAGWKQVPPANQMRLAEILVPDASGDAAKACMITFSSAGGSVEANIARWAGQFKNADGESPPAPITQRTIAGFKVHTCEIAGAYQGMTDPAPLPDWMLRGAIIENGEQMLFIKMTGPKAGMLAAADGWTSLIDSTHNNSAPAGGGPR
ncbi:MAG: hypothetical protein IT435_16680 [Phycisphaerales bacterium]|nr:hypothetical protein [Phycisphaerales bacterium]